MTTATRILTALAVPLTSIAVLGAFVAPGAIAAWCAALTGGGLVIAAFLLAASHRKLRQVQSTLQQADRELARRNDEAEQLMSTASHELKSPLATIQGFLGHLVRDCQAGRTDRLPEFARRIQDAADHLRERINDLLALGRIGHDDDPACVPVTELVRDLVSQREPQITARGVIVQVSRDMPALAMDRRRLQQVFDNLLTNALKYGCTRPNPRIEIGSQLTDHEVRFFVRDNGPGIPPQYHQKVFGLFQRLEHSQEGSGVGLAIVQRVVERQRGRAWLESAINQGATFWFALPAELVAQPAALTSSTRGNLA